MGRWLRSEHAQGRPHRLILFSAISQEDDLHQADATAQTNAAGVSITPNIGINVSSQRGYPTTASAKVTFTTARRLCGTRGLPGSSPGLLVAQP